MREPSWSTSVTVPADDVPLTLAEAKHHCGVGPDVHDDDTLVEAYRWAAAQVVEAMAERALLAQTVVRTATGFPCDGEPIVLPRPPLKEVTAVQYRDAAGVLQTWDPSKYRVIKSGRFGQIVPAFGQCYPATECDVPDAVTITFTCGATDVDAVPARLMQAQRLLVAHWYANREAVNVGNLVTELPYGLELVVGAPARVDPCC